MEPYWAEASRCGSVHKGIDYGTDSASVVVRDRRPRLTDRLRRVGGSEERQAMHRQLAERLKAASS